MEMLAAKNAHQCNTIADNCFPTKRFLNPYQKKLRICQNHGWISNKELINMSVEGWFSEMGIFAKPDINPETFEQNFQAIKRNVNPSKNMYALGCGIVQTVNRIEKKYCSYFTCDYQSEFVQRISWSNQENMIPNVVHEWKRRIDKVFIGKTPTGTPLSVYSNSANPNYYYPNYLHRPTSNWSVQQSNNIQNVQSSYPNGQFPSTNYPVNYNNQVPVQQQQQQIPPTHYNRPNGQYTNYPANNNNQMPIQQQQHLLPPPATYPVQPTYAYLPPYSETNYPLGKPNAQKTKISPFSKFMSKLKPGKTQKRNNSIKM